MSEPSPRNSYAEARIEIACRPPSAFRYEEQDDESTCTSINFQEFLHDSDLFDKCVRVSVIKARYRMSSFCRDASPYGYDDLAAADPNGFSTALVPNPQIALSPPQPVMSGQSAWNGTYADMKVAASPNGAVPNMCLTNL